MKRNTSASGKGTMRWLLNSLALAALLAAVALAAPGHVSAAGNNSVTMGMWSSPGNSTLPHFYHLGYARAVYRLAFSSLLEWDDNLNIVPRMAESFEVSEDGKTYLFKIRQDALWHDGQPVTSKDVEFTILCLTDPDYAFMDFNLVSGISGAKARKKGESKDLPGFRIIDDKTFEVQTDGVFAPLLDGFTELHILPHHVLKDIAVKDLAKSEFAANPTVGCGPYQFVKYATDQYVEFVRFDKFFLGAPKIERAFIRIVSPDTAIAQLERGELDLVLGETLGDIPNIEIARLQKAQNLNIQTASSPFTQGMMFNCQKEDLKNPKVRQAFAHAINAKGVVDKILVGGGIVTAIPRAAGYPYYLEEPKPYEYNPDKARKMLEEAGWNKERVLQLAVPTGNKERMQWATVAHQNLTEIGIKAELTQYDIATLIKTMANEPEKIDAFFIGYKNYMDPYLYFQRRFHTESIPGGNLQLYSNPEVDKAIDHSAAILDKDERMKDYRFIQETLYKELPVIPMVCPTSTIAVNKRVQGVKSSILPLTRNIHEWEIK